MTRTLAALTLLLPLAACDKGEDQAPTETPEPTDEAPPEATPEPGSPDVPWTEKDHQQRMEFMGLVVYPSMKEAFQGYDAERFAEFKCQTCHGDDAKEVGYEMPNAVTPLSADDPVAAGKDMDAEMTQFMMETVVPKMNEHLEGEEVKCLSCHLEG